MRVGRQVGSDQGKLLDLGGTLEKRERNQGLFSLHLSFLNQDANRGHKVQADA
jgi:hypothetical protein